MENRQCFRTGALVTCVEASTGKLEMLDASTVLARGHAAAVNPRVAGPGAMAPCTITPFGDALDAVVVTYAPDEATCRRQHAADREACAAAGHAPAVCDRLVAHLDARVRTREAVDGVARRRGRRDPHLLARLDAQVGDEG